MILSMAALMIAWFGFTFAHHSVAMMVFWMVLTSMGVGGVFAATPILIVEVSPADRVSEATGLAQIVRKMAMACGAQLIAVSLARSTVAVDGGVYPDGSAFFTTFLLIAVCTTVGFGLCLALPRHRAGGTPALA